MIALPFHEAVEDARPGARKPTRGLNPLEVLVHSSLGGQSKLSLEVVQRKAPRQSRVTNLDLVGAVVGRDDFDEGPPTVGEVAFVLEQVDLTLEDSLGQRESLLPQGCCCEHEGIRIPADVHLDPVLVNRGLDPEFLPHSAWLPERKKCALGSVFANQGRSLEHDCTS